MKMQKRKFRIGELATLLNVERFVIRFWEKEFMVKPTRSHGGQRFYDEEDYRLFQKIKELLYERGFTIAGARKQLKTAAKEAPIVPSQKTTMPTSEQGVAMPVTREQIIILKERLIKLRELL